MHSRAALAIAAALIRGPFFGFYGDSRGSSRYTYGGGYRRPSRAYPYSSKRQDARTVDFVEKMAARGRDATGKQLAA